MNIGIGKFLKNGMTMESIESALRRIVAAVTAGFQIEHKETGAHSDVTADTLAVSGETTFSDAVTVNADLTVEGTATAPATISVLVDGTNGGTWGTTASYDAGVFQNNQAIWSGDNGSTDGSIGLWSSNTAVLGATPSPSAGIALQSDVMVYSAVGSGRHAFQSPISVPDGSTAPTAVSGSAIIYVDTSDGDLKVIFGDGTIKTLATDT